MSTSTTCWSAENATKAYLNTLRMCERGREPDVAEFVSALAAGNNSRLMVIAGGTSPHSTVQALVAAGHQTGGRVICILPPTLQASQYILGRNNGPQVEFVFGDPKRLLTTQYDNADFVLVDCSLHNYHDILAAVVSNNNNNARRQNGTVVVGYNYRERSGLSSSLSYGVKTQFLPIGEGLLVTRFGGNMKKNEMMRKKSKWIVKVDKCTGEEHVFRVRFPQAKVIHA